MCRFLAVNLISLAMLTQVDGNYFMLLYVLTAVYVLKTAAEAREKTLWRGGMGVGVWVLLFSVFFTSMTSWNWSLGFSPVSFSHKGYYDHREAARQEMVSKGKRKNLGDPCRRSGNPAHCHWRPSGGAGIPM